MNTYKHVEPCVRNRCSRSESVANHWETAKSNSYKRQNLHIDIVDGASRGKLVREARMGVRLVHPELQVCRRISIDESMSASQRSS